MDVLAIEQMSPQTCEEEVERAADLDPLGVGEAPALAPEPGVLVAQPQGDARREPGEDRQPQGGPNALVNREVRSVPIRTVSAEAGGERSTGIGVGGGDGAGLGSAASAVCASRPEKRRPILAARAIERGAGRADMPSLSRSVSVEVGTSGRRFVVRNVNSRLTSAPCFDRLRGGEVSEWPMVPDSKWV